MSNPAGVAARQKASMPSACSAEPMMRLMRWPSRSASHPVGTSSANTQKSPAARIVATSAGEKPRSWTIQTR